MAYLGEFLTWSGGVPVSDVPSPSEQTFNFACIYSDGSQEFVTDPSSCPTKPGIDLLEVDDLSQVATGTTFPQPRSPGITINVPLPPILLPGEVPSLPTFTPPFLPVQMPPAPTATAPPDSSGSMTWLLVGLGVLLLGAGAGIQRRRRVSR